MLSPNRPDFDALWDYSNPEQTEFKFREILLQFPEDDPAFLELLTQIARAQGQQQKFDKAHQTLDQIERRVKGQTSRARVRYLLERGRVFNSSGKPDESRPFFEQARDLAVKLSEDNYAVDAVHMLAITAPPESALDLNLLAIRMAESSGQEKTRDWLGSLYNNTGWSYHDMGEYEKALEIFQNAEAFRREKGSVPQIRIARWCVARTLRSLHRIDEALSRQMTLKEDFDKTGENDGYVFEEIGECLILLNRTEEAHPYFAMAYKLLSQDPWLADMEPDRLARLKQLGASGG
jgi:tetratricopeptide (TPR) repeat protein